MRASNKGYIAVTSAIIISFLVMAIAIALSFSTYFSRFNILDAQSKERSVAAAESCADTTLLKLAQNGSYSGNETITVATSTTCTIGPIQTQGSQKIITTSSTVKQTVTIITVVVNASPLSIVSWEETP